jgi:2,3-bisphosphoglycerate-dependent phosphoglycerate mutase
MNNANTNKKPCTIYVIRHGETEWNIAQKMQGQHDSPLTPAGIEQAKQRAKTLAHINFAEIFSSDLLRAKRTAEIIALEHQITVKTSQLIRERNFGKYEGIEISAYRKALQGLLQKSETLSEKEQFALKLDDDIESDEEISTRMIQFLREVAVAYPGKTIGIVCHGGIMRATLIHLGYGTFKELQHGAIENVGYYVLEADGVDFFIKSTDGISKTLLPSS